MNPKFENTTENSIDLNEFIKSYTKHWKWFALSVLVCICSAYTYIRYSTPLYQAQSKIQIIEDKGPSSELSVFKDLDLLAGGKNKVEDEIEIIKSRSNFIQVVKDLEINIRIYSMGKIIDSEIYGRQHPFEINFYEPDSIIHNSKFTFFIDLSTLTTFGYSEKEEDTPKVYSYGKNISTPIGDIIITPNIKFLKNYKEKRFRVSINPVASVAQSYQKRVNIFPVDKKSNIVNISMVDPIQRKAKDIINTLVSIYNKNAVEDKKTTADKTSEFINDRIADIYSNLSTVDQNAEDFKSGRGLTDIASQANINMNASAANEQQLRNASIQLDIASSLKDIVENEEGYEVLPPNIGISDAGIVNNTAKYNELVSQRKRLLKSSNEKNPVIVNLDQQLDGLKRSLKSGLNSTTNNLNLQVNSLSSQLSKINSRIYSAPKNERALRDITRKQQTTESLYLYLLQKREESQIAFASAAPKSKIIDNAYNSSNFPVSPKRKVIYLAFFILGLLVPFSIIYVDDLLDSKIHNKNGLEKIIENSIPVLAELPKLSKKEDKLVRNNDRSILAESLRILRTNLDYIIRSKKGSGKKNVIFVTSSVPGEGKTFLSSNLAMIFANTNKKVLLIGADIRNPKLYTFFSSNKEVSRIGKPKREVNIGLTEYLFDNTLNCNDIINPMLVHENAMDVIYSGKIPPNPAELLMSSRIEELFSQVSEKYDYVIVDTAPLMVVTDTLLISEYANHILYVTKASVTEKKALEFPIKLLREKKIKNLSFVVNNVKQTDLGYGGKYGYGYGEAKKKWWKFGA